MEYGLTLKGFSRKPYTQIIADKYERARSFFGEDVDLSDRSPLALYIQADSWEESKLWDTLEHVYFSAYVDDAQGKQLNSLVKHIGIKRKPAQCALGEVFITGEASLTIPLGTQLMTETGVVFSTTESITLDANGEGNGKIKALVPGRQGNVAAGKINKLFIAVVGIYSVINNSATSGGTPDETDEELRERYYRSLSGRGKATREAVEAALIEIESVQDAYVKENVTMNTVDGLPPKSIAPYVYNGDEDKIVRAILDTKAGGIQSYGDVTAEVYDSKGNPHKIGYTKAKSIDVYVNISLVRNTLFKPETEKEIISAVVNYIGGIDSDGSEYRGLRLGQSVIQSKIIALAHATGVDEVKAELSKDGINYFETSINVPAMEIATTSFDKVVVT